MGDIVFLLVAAAFFAVCAVYVRACERLVEGDGTAPAPTSGDAETAEVAR